MFYLMEDEEFIKVVEEHPKLYSVILGMKRMRELKISGLFYVKLVLLLCGHSHIIKTDKNTAHERRCFIWLQNQQIYMQGLNRM